MVSVEKEFRNIMTRLSVSLLFFAILFPLLTGGVSALGDLLTSVFPRSDAVYIAADLASSFAYLISFILPVPFFYLISKGVKNYSLKLELKLPEPHPILSYVAIILAGLAIITPMTYVNSLIFPVPYGDMELFGFDFSQPYKLVLTFIASAIVPAFAEEFLFRGLLVSNLRPYGKSVAVIISAVAFGFMHQNPLQLLYATAAGIVFGVVYVETESIWCCIALHFVNNFISVMQSYSSYVFDQYTVSVFNFFFVLLTVIVGLICAIFLVSSMKKRAGIKRAVTQRSYWGHYELSDAQTCEKVNFVSVAFKNPVFIIYIVACATEIVSFGALLYVSSLGG